MRWTGLILGSMVTLLPVVASTPALGYEDVGYDAEGDSTADPDLYGAGMYDIRSSERRVVRGPNHRNLTVATRVSDRDFWGGSYVSVDAMLDARGGRQADAVLHIWMMDMSGNGCELQTRGGRLIRNGSLRFVGEPSGDDPPHYVGVSCRVPVHRLHPTKEIRWKVSIIYGNGEPVFDVAPNEGMYS